MARKGSGRKRQGRPPGGVHPGDRVKDYPQVSLRLPPAQKLQLEALSILRKKPQWRVLIEAIDCLLDSLSETERQMFDEAVRRLR